MNTDFSNILAWSVGSLLIAFLVWVGLTALVVWIIYTVIWTAVRRGLREFHHPDLTGKQWLALTQEKSGRRAGPRDW